MSDFHSIHSRSTVIEPRALRDREPGLADLLREPVVIGAFGVTLGALAGAMLPVSRPEEDYLGRAAERTTREVGRIASEQSARGRDFAKETAERAWGDLKAEVMEEWHGAPSSPRTRVRGA